MSPIFIQSNCRDEDKGDWKRKETEESTETGGDKRLEESRETDGDKEDWRNQERLMETRRTGGIKRD